MYLDSMAIIRSRTMIEREELDIEEIQAMLAVKIIDQVIDQMSTGLEERVNKTGLPTKSDVMRNVASYITTTMPNKVEEMINNYCTNEPENQLVDVFQISKETTITEPNSINLINLVQILTEIDPNLMSMRVDFVPK